jgi:hypothetical protein
LPSENPFSFSKRETNRSSTFDPLLPKVKGGDIFFPSAYEETTLFDAPLSIVISENFYSLGARAAQDLSAVSAVPHNAIPVASGHPLIGNSILIDILFLKMVSLQHLGVETQMNRLSHVFKTTPIEEGTNFSHFFVTINENRSPCFGHFILLPFRIEFQSPGPT